ncbi:MAG: DnaD domain protein [Bacilli bacterium]|nr:DnaD domain protein [Bacilli bacterium]
MKTKRLLDVVKTSDLIIPSILLLNYKDLNISEKELIFLSLLMNVEGDIVFDPVYFSQRLGFDVNEIMEMISNLSTKNYVEIVVKKEDKKMKEYISIDSFYEKLLLSTVEQDEVNIENSTIYNTIEEEFGRTLSPIEYETISGWLNAKIDEGLIKEALKEAVLNGVNNLKYIDKILYEWTKKGYKKASDVKKRPKKEPEEIELFSYDWLDENDE